MEGVCGRSSHHSHLDHSVTSGRVDRSVADRALRPTLDWRFGKVPSSLFFFCAPPHLTSCSSVRRRLPHCASSASPIRARNVRPTSAARSRGIPSGRESTPRLPETAVPTGQLIGPAEIESGARRPSVAIDPSTSCSHIFPKMPPRCEDRCWSVLFSRCCHCG